MRPEQCRCDSCPLSTSPVVLCQERPFTVAPTATIHKRKANEVLPTFSFLGYVMGSRSSHLTSLYPARANCRLLLVHQHVLPTSSLHGLPWSPSFRYHTAPTKVWTLSAARDVQPHMIAYQSERTGSIPEKEPYQQFDCCRQTTEHQDKCLEMQVGDNLTCQQFSSYATLSDLLVQTVITARMDY
jgi:hypothetical protein